ncbi:MAG: FIST N-terminal domain-containing protein, partial [Pseudomonadota bacterium]
AALSSLRIARPDWTSDFACLLVDGLSLKEDQLAAALAAALGPTPFFGGSAGDGLRFQSTKVLADGTVRGDAAVAVLVRSSCPFQIFKIDHHAPTDVKMVVTAADPERRIVSEINAEPAAAEYARILGKDPGQLTPFFFAAHPLLVQIGGQKHVRSIQRVRDDGALVFFSAIDEGVVLTVAEAGDIAAHLDESLHALGRDRAPEAIIGFDCILRRLEAEQSQAAGAVSRCFSRHGVVGFNTYGEQINGAHVNQTLTGIAVYAPDEF